MFNNKKTEEQLLNRILINFVIALISYIVLYIMYARFYMMNSMIFGFVFLGLSILGYILNATKILKFSVINYAHMFLAYSFAMFFANLSRIFGTMFGMQKLLMLTDSSQFFKMLFNGRIEVIIISWLGAVYLIAMLIYNTVLINRKQGNK